MTGDDSWAVGRCRCGRGAEEGKSEAASQRAAVQERASGGSVQGGRQVGRGSLLEARSYVHGPLGGWCVTHHPWRAGSHGRALQRSGRGACALYAAVGSLCVHSSSTWTDVIGDQYYGPCPGCPLRSSWAGRGSPGTGVYGRVYGRATGYKQLETPINPSVLNQVPISPISASRP